MPEITIRKAERMDLPALGFIYAQAFNGNSAGEKWSNENAEAFISQWFEKQPDLFYIALEGNKIIGGAVGEVMTVDVGPCLREVELFVSPECQSKGVGRALLRQLIFQARESYDANSIAFLADSRFEFPYAWYREIGMRETGWSLLWGNADEMLDKLK